MQRRRLGILKRTFGNYQKSGDEYLFYCPKCNHHKKKLSINLKKDVYKCWVCDLKGRKLHRLVRRYGQISDRHEWEQLSPVEIPNDLREYFTDFYSKEVVDTKVTLPEEFETLSEPQKNKEHMAAKRYLYSRGLSDWDIVYWKIGYCRSGPYGGRVVIPSFDSRGDVNYFVGRAYGDFLYNYKNPKVNKKNIIFNELFIDWKNDLTIVEGPFDAIKAANAVPILGSTLNIEYRLFQEIVRHDTPVFVALDKDAIGKELRLIKELLKYEVEVYKIDTSCIETDIGDLTKEEFLDLKNDAVLMSETNLLREKMRMIL